MIRKLWRLAVYLFAIVGFCGLVLLALGIVGWPLTPEALDRYVNVLGDYSKHDWLTDAMHRLPKDGSQALSRKQLAVLAGEPEVKVDIEAFYQLLKESTADPDHQMLCVYSMYRFASGAAVETTAPPVDRGQWERQNAGWQDSESFLNCQVWLYHWEEPIAIYVGSWLTCKPVPGDYLSQFYLVDGHRVLGGGMITGRLVPSAQ